MAFCYFDPNSVWDRACRLAMTQTHGPIAFHHRHAANLADDAASLASAQRADEWLELVAGPWTTEAGEPQRDHRITAAVTALHHLEPHEKLSALELAELVGLSSSRFLHLFREQTGTTLRRYRLWLRMLHAAALVSDTADLTTAAAGAGFANPSHLTNSFHAMFGLPALRS